MISKKRVLVLLYSQTGQLSDVVEQMLAPLQADSAIEVSVHALRPLKLDSPTRHAQRRSISR